MLAPHEARDSLRQARVAAREHAMNVGHRVEQDALRPRFMVHVSGDDIFEEVRERTMPDVMEQRCADRVAAPLGRRALPEG